MTNLMIDILSIAKT